MEEGLCPGRAVMGERHSIDLRIQSALGPGTVRHLAIALILAVSLWIISPLPAASQSIEEYFQISYDPVSLSKNEIHGSEVFYATIRGLVTCTKDLPMSVGEASITSRIIAEDTESGNRVTLNPSYTVTIKPFPSKKGENTEINEVVHLQFPAQAESGDYNVIGELIEAKVKIAFAWADVTGYLPQAQFMGSLKHTAQEPALKPTPIPTPPSPPTTAPTRSDTAWWVWLLVAVAVATTVVNIIWYLRRRIA